MIYPHLDLRIVSLFAGFLLIFSHGAAFMFPKPAQEWLRKFPRSRQAGIALLLVDAVWAFAMVATMDLGEFTHLRTVILVLVVAGTCLTIRYVDEFLAVRALGILALLAAEPLIEAAYLQPQGWRVLLVLYAYTLAILGMIWVSMPYKMRDQIDWLRGSPAFWKAVAVAGVLYGCALAGVAIFL